MDTGDGGCVSGNIYYMLYIHIFINGARQGNTRTCPGFSKKILKLVLNPFIKIEPHPIRGEARRLPEKTRLIPRKKNRIRFKHPINMFKYRNGRKKIHE